MRLYPESFHHAYKNIVYRARASTTTTTFLIVSPDVDAICAARLLSNMLKADYVPNTIIPVPSWHELVNLRARFEEEAGVRTVVFINVGALIDIHYYFEYLPPTCIIHLIDSHRPINLANLYTPSPYAMALFPRHASDQAPQQEHLPPAELSVVAWMDTEGDQEAEQADEEAFLALYHEPESDSDESFSDEDTDLEESNSSRLTRQEKKRFRTKVDKYYSTTFSGQSVAHQVYLLMVLAKRESEDAVWLAIIGLTYQFVTNQIDRARYDGYANILAAEVDRLRTNQIEESQSQRSSPNDRSIYFSEEPRFCLFRHWNLYDSMRHSAYVASKMKLWKDRGMKNLSGMLAKMGYSLQQSQETYAHMDSDLKKELFLNIERNADQYGLDDLMYGSFIRKAGYKTEISAADAVEAISTLLEAGTGVQLGVVDLNSDNPPEDCQVGLNEWIARHGGQNYYLKEDEEEDINLKENEMERRKRKAHVTMTRNFWLAWDGLSNDTTLLRLSLPLSMGLYRAVTGQGTYILDKGDIKGFRTYRLAVVKEGPYLKIFQHPVTLLRLAQWLVATVRDILESNGTVTGKGLPFVLACLNPETNMFLVVGVVGAVEYGDVKKNVFGMAFQQAAEESRSDFRQDTFDASVIQIAKDDFPRFLKLLSLK